MNCCGICVSPSHCPQVATPSPAAQRRCQATVTRTKVDAFSRHAAVWVCWFVCFFRIFWIHSWLNRRYGNHGSGRLCSGFQELYRLDAKQKHAHKTHQNEICKREKQAVEAYGPHLSSPPLPLASSFSHSFFLASVHT